jgi:hypothetical protein
VGGDEQVVRPNPGAEPSWVGAYAGIVRQSWDSPQVSQLQLHLGRTKVEDKMSRQVTIETPFPSLAETAHTLGVSPAEAERVQRILSEHKPRARARANGRPRQGSRYARKRASKKA